MSRVMQEIRKPTPDAVRKAVKNWETNLFAPCIDDCLFAFFKQYRENNDFDVVRAKIILVNTTYGTRLSKDDRDTNVPDHIINLKIDERLKSGDLSVVNEIARVKNRNLYSFASKFCMFHNPEKFAVYDSNVDKSLWCFYENDNDFRNVVKFKRCELKNYERFIEILNTFIKHYELEDFSYRELDHYLWEVGNKLN